MKISINKWPNFKDHDVNCTTLNAAGCTNKKLSYVFNHNSAHTPITVTFTCTNCSLTTTLNYSTAAGGFLALSTRVGYTEPRHVTLSWSYKNSKVRRY